MMTMKAVTTSQGLFELTDKDFGDGRREVAIKKYHDGDTMRSREIYMKPEDVKDLYALLTEYMKEGKE